MQPFAFKLVAFHCALVVGLAFLAVCHHSGFPRTFALVLHNVFDYSSAMSCRAKRADDAVRLCSNNLLACEELESEYAMLKQLSENPQCSHRFSKFCKPELEFEKFQPYEWQSRKVTVKTLDILQYRKLNCKEKDHTTQVLLKTGDRIDGHSWNQRVFVA